MSVRRKHLWDLWVALSILVMILLQEAYFWLAVDLSKVIASTELIVLQWSIVVLLAVLTTGLLLRKVWAWWLAILSLPLLAGRSIYYCFGFILEHGEFLTLYGILEVIVTPMPLISATILIVICRIRGAYRKEEVVGQQQIGPGI